MPTATKNDAPAMRIAQWCDALDAGEQFLLAGLRRKIEPDGDLRASYRQWYEDHMREHDLMLIHLAEELTKRGGGHGG
ncbi:MAG: hypothetical protein IT426_16275 [Pirellulales bacterium]|nr:hypothetical protein [Pirellulales bacterium]